MGKKRNRKKYISKGVHSKTNKTINTLIRAQRAATEKLEFLSIAWKKLQNPWLTIENPNKEQTNRRMIRVRANDYWGNPKYIRE